jgi:TonB family protein
VTGEGNMMMGGAVFGLGLVVTIGSMAFDGGGGFVLAYGAIIGGAAQFLIGAAQASREEDGGETGPLAAHPPRLVSGPVDEYDYPPAAADAGEEGSATAGFVIGADGRVRDVQLVRSSGSASLDEATCRLIAERFLYEAAKDRNMNPVAVRHEQKVTWRLPLD